MLSLHLETVGSSHQLMVVTVCLPHPFDKQVLSSNSLLLLLLSRGLTYRLGKRPNNLIETIVVLGRKRSIRAKRKKKRQGKEFSLIFISAIRSLEGARFCPLHNPLPSVYAQLSFIYYKITSLAHSFLQLLKEKKII